MFPSHDRLAIYNFDQKGHQEEYYCLCGGQLCGCESCVYEVQRYYWKYYEYMKGGEKYAEIQAKSKQEKKS